jgi:hypothetical protein
VSNLVGSMVRWADGRDVTAAYRVALDDQQDALSDMCTAWDRFVAAQTAALALRESGDDLRSAA